VPVSEELGGAGGASFDAAHDDSSDQRRSELQWAAGRPAGRLDTSAVPPDPEISLARPGCSSCKAV